MNSLRIAVATALLLAAASTASNAFAQAADQGKTAAAAAASSRLEMSDGEVRKIDADNRKITLKHGEIKNLEMPGMTMVFQVKDAAMLSSLQVGSKVKFRADRVDGAFVVTGIQPLK